MSPTARVLLALVLGLGAGALAALADARAVLALVPAVRPAGALWVNAVLMTVVPLVVSNLVVSVAAAADARVVGRVGARAVAVAGALLAGGAVLAAVAAPPLVAALPVGPAAAGALRAAVGAGAAPAPPDPGAWVAALAPSNPVRAAADGAMLPLVVFTLLFALALTRIEPELGRHVVRTFEGVARATGVLLGWVLRAAPAGVFALAFALGAQAGGGAAGALASYVALSAALSLAATAALYVVAAAGGRVPVGRFARAAAPAQLVAATTRSSLAALPAMLRAADESLALPPVAGGVFLPFAAATFKFSAPMAFLTAAAFMGRVLGLELGTPQLLALAPLAVAMSVGVPGVPGGWLAAAPVFAAAGLPVEVVGVLLAVDAVPDTFRTVGNVTADLAAAAVVGRAGAGR